MKRWSSILLVVSLVLNIFLVGAIAGGLWRWTHNQGLGLRAGWRMRAAEALPPDRAEAFRQTVRGAMRDNLELGRQARAARAEAARLFVAPRFDTAAVRGQLAQARQADSALRARLEDEVVGFAATLPPDQRAALAQALRTGPLRQRRARQGR